MRRMNSMLLGHQGASARTTRMYFSIATSVAGSSQDSGRWTMRLGTRSDSMSGKLGLERRSAPSSRFGRQLARVVVDLQRADAGREVDDPGQGARLQRLHQGVGPEAQRQVERQRAVLDQQVVVARPAGRRRGCGASSAPSAAGWATLGRAGGRRGTRCAERRATSDRPAPAAARPAAPALCGLGHRAEAHPVARLELAHLPALGLDDGGGADEAAQAGAVGAEDDRHVAGEVHRADGVGVVVDVRRVQARPRRRPGGPRWAWGRSGGRRCGRSCSGPASRWRRTSRCRRR